MWNVFYIYINYKKWEAMNRTPLSRYSSVELGQCLIRCECSEYKKGGGSRIKSF